MAARPAPPPAPPQPSATRRECLITRTPTPDEDPPDWLDYPSFNVTFKFGTVANRTIPCNFLIKLHGEKYITDWMLVKPVTPETVGTELVEVWSGYPGRLFGVTVGHDNQKGAAVCLVNLIVHDNTAGYEYTFDKDTWIEDTYDPSCCPEIFLPIQTMNRKHAAEEARIVSLKVRCKDEKDLAVRVEGLKKWGKLQNLEVLFVSRNESVTSANVFFYINSQRVLKFGVLDTATVVLAAYFHRFPAQLRYERMVSADQLAMASRRALCNKLWARKSRCGFFLSGIVKRVLPHHRHVLRLGSVHHLLDSMARRFHEAGYRRYNSGAHSLCYFLYRHVKTTALNNLVDAGHGVSHFIRRPLHRIRHTRRVRMSFQVLAIQAIARRSLARRDWLRVRANKTEMMLRGRAVRTIWRMIQLALARPPWILHRAALVLQALTRRAYVGSRGAWQDKLKQMRAEAYLLACIEGSSVLQMAVRAKLARTRYLRACQEKRSQVVSAITMQRTRRAAIARRLRTVRRAAVSKLTPAICRLPHREHMRRMVHAATVLSKYVKRGVRMLQDVLAVLNLSIMFKRALARRAYALDLVETKSLLRLLAEKRRKFQFQTHLQSILNPPVVASGVIIYTTTPPQTPRDTDVFYQRPRQSSPRTEVTYLSTPGTDDRFSQATTRSSPQRTLSPPRPSPGISPRIGSAERHTSSAGSDGLRSGANTARAHYKECSINDYRDMRCRDYPLVSRPVTREYCRLSTPLDVPKLSPRPATRQHPLPHDMLVYPHAHTHTIKAATASAAAKFSPRPPPLPKLSHALPDLSSLASDSPRDSPRRRSSLTYLHGLQSPRHAQLDFAPTITPRHLRHLKSLSHLQPAPQGRQRAQHQAARPQLHARFSSTTMGEACGEARSDGGESVDEYGVRVGTAPAMGPPADGRPSRSAGSAYSFGGRHLAGSMLSLAGDSVQDELDDNDSPGGSPGGSRSSKVEAAPVAVPVAPPTRRKPRKWAVLGRDTSLWGGSRLD